MRTWLGLSLLLAALAACLAGAAMAQDGADDIVVVEPPLHSRWFAKTRWTDAYAIERVASYDKIKIAEAIAAWQMYLDLYPNAGDANEVAWKITTLTTRYREVDKTIAAYESYIAAYPDGDYAADALYSLISQYMRIPDWPAVYEKYDEFLQRFGRSPYGDEAIYGLAGRMKTERNYAGALDLYLQLLDKYPTSDYCDDALSAIGYIYSQRMEVDLATEAYFTLANDYPYSNLVEPSLQQMVYMYYRTGDVMKAIELGQTFLEAFPQSRYSRTVRMYMYYAARKARVMMPGMDIGMPGRGADAEEDEFSLARQEHDDLYTRASGAAKVQDYSSAVGLYQDFIMRYPSSDKIDDALYAIGGAFDALEAYAGDAEKAKTPEQFAQVERNWAHVAQGFEAGMDGGAVQPVVDAINAYIILSQSMPGSDYRDDALYKVAADYEKLEAWVPACNAYLALIGTYPVSTWANTAVTRLNALYPKLPTHADRAAVMTAVITTYPHHSLSDDFTYKIAVQNLLNGDVRAAQAGFVNYVENYPSRSLAPEALFWRARCEQLLGNGMGAGVMYGRLAASFLQSGLADDGYIEYQYIRAGASDEVLQAGLEALNRAAATVEKPLIGYDTICRNHVLLMVPSDKAIDVRAYNIPDRLEQAYLQMADFCGGVPNGGKRIEILVDADVKAFTAGTPMRVPASMVGPPPKWRHWFEAVASAFVADPAIAPVTTAIPGLADGAARFASAQMEDLLYTELGEINVGATAVRTHLSDLNATKRAAAKALAAHVKAKGTADKIDVTIGLGIMWSLSERLAAISGEVIDWTPLMPLFPAARQIPIEAAQSLETLEQKAALATIWVNSGLGKDYTSTLRSWGLPVTAEEMAAVQASIDAAKPPAEDAATPAG